jgi:hypothetical protein
LAEYRAAAAYGQGFAGRPFHFAAAELRDAMITACFKGLKYVCKI